MFAAIVGQSWADDAHPYNLEVNGVDRIGAASYPSIRLEMPGPGSNGSMSFELWDPDASIAIAEWDEVRFIEHAATRPILFGGFVQAVRYTAWAVTGRTITVECVGYGILLDRKVLLADYAQVTAGVFMSRHVVSLVNRYGGRVTASCAGDAATGGPWYTTVDHGVSDPSEDYVPTGYAWFTGAIYSSTPYVLPAGQTLRAALDSMSRTGGWWASTGVILDQPAPMTYWVDSAARFTAFPEMPSAEVTAAHLAAQYDGGVVPGLDVTPSAGTYRVVSLAVEREDTDRATAAYVTSSTTAGTGIAYTDGLERAGDLFAIISDDTSLTAEDAATRAASAVRATAAATVRSSVSLESGVPLDIRPGRNLRVTDARVGLTGEDWRVTSVRIAFADSTSRTYEIGFGGNLPEPSMARRQGRYARLPR